MISRRNPLTPEQAALDAAMADYLNVHVAQLAASLYTVSPEQRMAVFARFCTHCGSDNPACQCGDNE